MNLKYKEKEMLNKNGYTLSQVTCSKTFDKHHWFEVENKSKGSSILGFMDFDSAYEEYKKLTK